MKYEHLLAPLKIGNVTLKNRILGSKCVSSDNQEPMLSGPFYEHLARNGAAWVCVGVGAYPDCEGNYSKYVQMIDDIRLLGGEVNFQPLEGCDHHSAIDNAFTSERIAWVLSHQR